MFVAQSSLENETPIGVTCLVLAPIGDLLTPLHVTPNGVQ